MQRFVMTALLASALGTGAALAAPLSATYQTQPQSNLGGGVIELLFGGRAMAPSDPYAGRYQTARGEPQEWAQARRREADPRYQRQVVAYEGTEKAGTI